MRKNTKNLISGKASHPLGSKSLIAGNFRFGVLVRKHYDFAVKILSN